MRLVQISDGVLEIRWTWLPWWLAVNPKLKLLVDQELRDSTLLCGLTTSDRDLNSMHEFVVRRLVQLFPAFEGLAQYLDALRHVKEPAGYSA